MSAIETVAANSAAQADLAASERDSQTLASDLDMFLELLTAQLQNQDPLDPMDTDQMTDQITQFSQVEQQIQTNAHLEDLLSTSESQALNAVVGYLGSTVTAEGVATNLSGGEAQWTLQTDQNAPNTQITIFDENGREVYSTPLALNRGETQFTWDGQTTSGAQAEDGVYTIRAVGQDANGDPVSVDASISGVVSSIDMTENDPILQVGGVPVSLSSVQRVDAAG
ncbi:MAG: flagellar hook assembly protein FlgD [Devosiaceae bacterium]|nr:flagellar hook assembly protein FlgD [Devosiaceae bacterium MH13]